MGRGSAAVNYSTDFKCIRDEGSTQEWQARLDLAACYRLVDQYGMTDLIYNHITARIPGTEHWNGRRCCARSRPSSRIRVIRRTRSERRQ